MAGNLELETLQQDVAAGAIDTVLVCFTDMQGGDWKVRGESSARGG
jgi:hypothetical protein